MASSCSDMVKVMEQCKIDFTSIPWEMPADGVRFKAYRQNGKQVRLVEFTDKLVEIVEDVNPVQKAFHDVGIYQ